jgi:MFS family permease
MSSNVIVQDAPLKRPPALFRWTVLIFASLAMFGNYYVYDAISPLADVLAAQLNFSDSNIGLLNAIYSLPNIFMVFIGGIIIDLIGMRKSLMIFGALCMAGAIITASSPDIWIMASGRLVFGLGAESLIVAVTAALAKWFRGKELSFAMGINLTIARLGSFLALNSPSWAKPAYENWQAPLLITVAFATFCVLGPIIYWILEVRAEKRYDMGSAETDEFKFSHIFKFSKSYWFIVGLCATFYGAIFPFQTFAIKFFQHAHDASREYAGFLSSLLVLFAMIATPLFGLFVDRFGKRTVFMIIGSFMLLPVYLMMAYTGIPLLVPMMIMGVAFSVIPAIMWPAVSYVVPERRLGTAYGLMTMLQNIGLTAFNFMVGFANDAAGAGPQNPDGYEPMMWIFTVLVLLAVFFSFMLRKVESGPNAHGLDTITTKTTE